MSSVPKQLLAFANDAIEDSPFWQPFTQLPASFSDEEKQNIITNGKEAVKATMLAFKFLHDEFVAKVLSMTFLLLSSFLRP